MFQKTRTPQTYTIKSHVLKKQNLIESEAIKIKQFVHVLNENCNWMVTKPQFSSKYNQYTSEFLK